MFLDDKKASAIQKDNIIAFFACHLYYVTYVSNYFLSLQETITFFQRRCKQPNFLTMNSKKRNIETNKDSSKIVFDLPLFCSNFYDVSCRIMNILEMPYNTECV